MASRATIAKLSERIESLAEIIKPTPLPPEVEGDTQRLEGSLADFVEAAWPSIDTAGYQPHWAIEGLCEHLQAVTDGQIKRLLVNFPPRCGKTLITSVCFPAWTWARRERSFLSGAGVRFLCGSYSHTLSLMNSNMTRRLILSPWYQGRWGKRFTLRQDQNTKAQFDNSAGGSRLATSVGGSLLGLGGDLLLVDDPHNTEGVESEAERENVLNWWAELSTTRLNSPREAAIVVIMQRLHEDDVSGKILSGDEDWTHFCVPMEYEWTRHCVTVLGWQDPRGLDDDGEPLVLREPNGERTPRDAHAARILSDEREGMLMWPERFGPRELSAIKAGLGPYMASGRLQQSPRPRSGGILRREWWMLYEPVDGKFPPLEGPVIASLDSAFTKDQQNDPSALTVWGLFRTKEDNRLGIMLLHAWRKHLLMHGDPPPRKPNESDEWYRQRTSEHWGLVQWVAHTCRRFKVDHLLIEGKASGLTAADELRRLHGREGWMVQVCPVKGDKVSRALAVQPMFSQGLVWAPARTWADLVIDEASLFPLGRFDDLTDSATQALSYMRRTGLILTHEEAAAEKAEATWHSRRRSPLPKLYPC